MASLNQVQIIGNLGQDPEIRYMPNGEAVANISVATSEHWKDKESGEKKEATEWHRVTFYRRLAEVVGEYLTKGSSIFVQGKLRTRKWQDKDGVDRYTTEIIADQMVMLGSKQGGEGGGQRSSGRSTSNSSDYGSHRGGQDQRARAKPARQSVEDMDDDIPF